ncbi:hypothetical protein, partial [Methanothrix soehngenii]|uniref:hypothetical protein n=1 Tax=Methanothrix soehngenii TaxID=2223 RepID=UPI00300C147C
MGWADLPRVPTQNVAWAYKVSLTGGDAGSWEAGVALRQEALGLLAVELGLIGGKGGIGGEPAVDPLPGGEGRLPVREPVRVFLGG